jgi:hypothetical protein
MRIEILRRTSFAGQPLLAGEVVDIPDRDARYLVGTSKAREAQDPDPDPEPVAQKPRIRKSPISEAA